MNRFIKRTVRTLIILITSISLNNYIATGDTQYNKNYDTTYKVYTRSLDSEEDLNEYGRQFLKDNFNLNLDIPIIFKEENKKRNGEFLWDTLDIKAHSIIIYKNKEYRECIHDIERTLIHELTHYAVFQLSNGDTTKFRDGCEEFEKINYNFGGLSNFLDYRSVLETRLLEYCCN